MKNNLVLTVCGTTASKKTDAALVTNSIREAHQTSGNQVADAETPETFSLRFAATGDACCDSVRRKDSAPAP
jgi:hypothetical protein